MDYLTFPLRHLARIREWLRVSDATAAISPFNFMLSIRTKNRKANLKPRFIVSNNGKLAYTEHFSDDAIFVGWYPYSPRQWDISTDKALFKKFAIKNGLRVPRELTVDSFSQDYVIKKNIGSFGEAVRGPFRMGNGFSAAARPETGEFAEAFVSGKSAKAWYWAGRPVALEIVPRPYIIGDGKRSLQELAASPRGSFDLSYSIETSASVLAWQGLDTSSITEASRKIYLDYRHASPYDRVAKADRDVWATTPKSLRQEFEFAGQVCMAHVAQQDSKNRMFTIDAIVDSEKRAWFLEINSNPMVHPGVYRPMLDSLFEIVAGQSELERSIRAEALGAN